MSAGPSAGHTRQLVLLMVGQIALHAAMAGQRMAAPLQALDAGHSAWTVGVLLALFAALPVLIAMPAGRMADRHGYHRPQWLAVGLSIFGVACALAACFLPGWWQFGLQCLGAAASGAGTNVGVIVVLRAAGLLATDSTERMKVFSWLGMAFSGANVLGPVTAGFLIDLGGFAAAYGALLAMPLVAVWVLGQVPRQPRQATLTQKLLDAGFSPALIRKLVDGLPADGDETEWAAQILQRNLVTGETESPLEDQGGVFALIGSTGVGKTTSTAKLAAAFATRHGAGHLGLITLDAYRVAAHEQLRAYGRILGVPVHTAHDRASLEDLLDLLSGKKMVLIDTAGMAQRDERTRELLDMLSHRAVNRLLVVNAASQGETIEDVLTSYRASNCRGVILSKIDEAMKLGPALDAMIRHKVKVLAVANGQRVPEDWHRMSAQGLLQRALRAGGSAAWKLDSNDVNLVFAAQPSVAAAMAHGA